MPNIQKPLVVALGYTEYVGELFLNEFKKDFEFEVLEAGDREQALHLLPRLVTERGPIYALIIRMPIWPYAPYDEALLGSVIPGCQIITTASAGFDRFDVNWMTKNKIWFCNTVDAVAEATADMAIFLILAVLRNTTRGEMGVRQGTWKEGLVPSRDPSGLTLGIVGIGSIGKYLAKKAQVFNLSVRYHKPSRLPIDVERQTNVTYCSTLHELLSMSDVVSINCPLNASTVNLISYKEFAAMRPGSFLVNTARGAIVNEEALIEALESGKVARAGLDVFENEPNIRPYFRQSDKVVVQPHIGGLTDVAFMKSERECFENIRSLFKTGRLINPVNDVVSAVAS